MKNSTFKKISFLFIVFFFFIFFKSEASSIILEVSKESIGINEQFYIDLLLDPENESLNGISGEIIFPLDILQIERIEDGKSMVNFWVDRPVSNGNTISFAGIMTNGFGGVIDPFNQSEKLPGLIIRVVFKALKPDIAVIRTSSIILNLNDGLGTSQNVSDTSLELSIQNIDNINNYKGENSIPEIEAYVVEDPNLFDNKYVLVFEAKDKVGIMEVLAKEGDRDWEKIESPYLLKDQNRRSLITLKAINYSGVASVFEITPLPYKTPRLFTLGLIVLAIIIFAIIRKQYVDKK